METVIATMVGKVRNNIYISCYTSEGNLIRYTSHMVTETWAKLAAKNLVENNVSAVQLCEDAFWNFKGRGQECIKVLQREYGLR